MKKIVFMLSAVVFWLASTSCYSQDDKAAIKAVIEKETTSFFGVDKKNWEVNWLDAPYTFWCYADSTGASSLEGTEKIKKNFDEYFRTAKPSKSKIERTWLEIKSMAKGPTSDLCRR